MRIQRWMLGLVAAGLLTAWTPSFAQDEKPEEKPAEQPAAETKPEEKPAAETKPEEKPAAETKPEEKPAADAKPEEKKPEGADKGKPTVEVVHLDNPSGVAVHPKTGHVFITSQQGVFRLLPASRPRKIYLEVKGFPTDEYGKGPKYNIGPLGCLVWGDDKLIVTDGSRKDGEELVRVYKIEEQPPSTPARNEDQAEFTLGPIAPGDLSPKGEGNFYQAAVFNEAIWVTSNGDDTKGWVAKAAIKDGKPEALTPTLATKEATEVDAPIAITTSLDGSQLVIGQGGEVNQSGDSLLTFYDKEGKLAKKYTTGLHDICGLAYSPDGKLYAVDFAWVDPAQGGLFELVIEGDECKPRKVLSLDRPSALAFDKEGGVFVTVFSTGEKAPEPREGDKPTPTGALLRIAKEALAQ